MKTRADLVAAAHRVLLRDGFHGASLDQIAEEAGYTTGAVYSDFQSKDELFLAVLDQESERRVPLHAGLLGDAPSLEGGLRRQVAERHERLLDAVAALVEAVTGRFGVELAILAREVVHGTYALSRGMGLERLLDDRAAPAAVFEETWGVTPATRMAGIGSPSPLHISRQLYAVLLAGRPGGAPPLTVTTPLPEMVAALNAYRPQVLTAYPSVAAQLAEEQLQGQLRIAPPLVATTSEALTADRRRRVRDAWGVEPIDFYGTTEAAVVAAGRRGQAGMDVLEDLVVVEVVDRHDRPVPPGTPGRKVLLTNLVNHAQPLIRYELTDSVTLAGGPNPLGLPYARIAAVDGRSDDVVSLPARGGGRVAVHPFRLRAPFAHLPEVRQYQVVHDGAALQVRVVLRAAAAPGTPDRVRAALVRELEDAGALPPPVEVVPVPAIPRDDGHGAKLELVRRALPPGGPPIG
jgi:AcrR family transcriptional regulator